MAKFRTGAATHRGTVRDHNEDRFIERADIGLWAVADGAGGHAAGELAAEMIANALASIPGGLGAEEMLAQVRMRIAAAHTALQHLAASRGEGAIIASTAVVLVIRQAHFACLWAGNSRAYLLRDGALLQVTRDHSLVQELVDAGEIAAQDAERHPRANVVTRAVGSQAEAIALDKATGAIVPGDRFLLCSDGLTKCVPAFLLADLLAADAPEAAARELVDAALARDARDNVTAVIVEVADDHD